MSKIQEALLKIRVARTNMKSPDQTDSSEPHNKIGSVVHRSSSSSQSEFGVGGKCVEIDRSRLREIGFLAPKEQEHSMADQYRIIKRPLLDYASGKISDRSPIANLVMVASAFPEEGKTFTCINLALSMAMEKDTSVVLIDADVPKPNMSRLFGVSDEPGLIELIKDSSLVMDSVILQTDVPGLSILPAGQHNELATELLASRRMARLVTDLSKRHSDTIMIFDSPPLLVTSEARVLAGHMGQILLIVYSGHTPQQAVGDALECLDPNKAISLALNQADGGAGANFYGRYTYEAG